MFKIATVTDARILEITKEYVEKKKSLDLIAKENKIGRATVKKYINYSRDIDEKLYNRAMLRLGRYKSSKKKKGMKLTLDVFESIGTKKISKKDLIDWWIKNVEVNDLPVYEIIRLAKLAGIEIIGG